MPMLVTHSPWLYWLRNPLSFSLFAFIGFGLNRLVFEFWIKRTSSVKAKGYVFGPHLLSVPVTVFLSCRCWFMLLPPMLGSLDTHSHGTP